MVPKCLVDIKDGAPALVFRLKFTSSYWTRFVLGLIAGLVLSELVPIGGEGWKELTKPTLAILGGFSVDIVHKVLARIVNTVEILIMPSESRFKHNGFLPEFRK